VKNNLAKFFLKTESAQFEAGTFSVIGWVGYPKGYPRPSGPFRLLEGEEYQNARLLANKTNRALRAEIQACSMVHIFMKFTR
jgi:hypothetical protein